MARRTTLALIALVGATAVLAGCGTATTGGSVAAAPRGHNDSSQPPARELSRAIAALGHSSTLTTEIKLGTSASDLAPIMGSLGATVTPAEVSTLAGAQITIEVAAPDGKTLDQTNGSGDPGALELTVKSKGTTYLSLISLNKTLYLQVDLKDLLAALGEANAYDMLDGESVFLPSFVQALLNDKWVALPVSALSSVGSMLGGLGTPPAGATPGPAAQRRLLGVLKSLYNKDVTVKRVSTGSTDLLTVSTNTRTIVRDLLSTVTSAVPGMSGALGSPTTRVPSQKITIDAAITGGALSALSINLGQFDPGKKLDLPLDLLFSRDGPAIKAPSGAVKIDPGALSDLSGGLGGGSLGSSFT